MKANELFLTDEKMQQVLYAIGSAETKEETYKIIKTLEKLQKQMKDLYNSAFKKYFKLKSDKEHKQFIEKCKAEGLSKEFFKLLDEVDKYHGKKQTAGS